MSTIATAVFDVVAALPGGASMREVVKAKPDIDPDQVISAVHRLSEKGVLRLHRVFGVGRSTRSRQAQRGRLMVAAGHASANNRRASLNLGRLLNAAELQAG